MASIRKNKNEIKNIVTKKEVSSFAKNIRVLNNNRGSAMITALVVGLVILAFCLSMLLVSYTLFAQTSRQNTQLQCKNIAQSFSEELKSELEDGKNAELTEYLKSEIGAKLDEAKADLEPGSTEIPVATVDMELKYSGDAADALAPFTVKVCFTATSVNSVDAVITCIRGDENDRDVQMYSVNRTYRLK